MRQASAINAARKARDELFSSGLTDEQKQYVVDFENAMQDLNNAYWERVGFLESQVTQILDAHKRGLRTIEELRDQLGIRSHP